MDMQRLIAVARGDAHADLLLTNARVVNTFTGEIEETSVAVAEGRVAGVGDYSRARRTEDLGGRYLAPGLIDGHVHIESSMLHVDQYARAVVPHGTVAAVTDLHEITNVCGLAGMRYIMECGRRVPLDLFFMVPSCVPATDMETSGATLTPADIRRALRWGGVLGLGEVMSFPAVINGEGQALEKLRAVGVRVRDGHAPRVRGRDLNAYLCPLIGSDHETTEYEEGLEKLRRGMHLMIREGSAEKNLEALLPLVTDQTYHRCMLVVDDRNALDLRRDGDVDAVVRKAIRLGLDPVRAVTLASLNPARYFGLEGYGAVAPGYWAHLLVISDLEGFQVDEVYYRGRRVSAGGRTTFRTTLPVPGWITRTVNVRPFGPEALAVKAQGERVPVIEIVPGQIVTRWAQEAPTRRDGAVVADPERDLAKLVVVERHRGTGNIGTALVRGFGLKRGAIGTSVAHDSHNIVVAGVSDEDILAVATEIQANQGGLACAVDGRVTASLPLPIAGLVSPEPLDAVADMLETLERASQDLGCELDSPYSVLSFLALPVIPELKLTDKGLVDVMAGRLLDG